MAVARSVGNIEITVNADTGRLTAQLRKGGQTAGQAGADAISRELGSLDTKRLQAQLKLIKRKVEAELSQIEADVGLDESELNADLKRLQARLRALQLELQIGTTINNKDLEKTAATLRARLSAMRYDIKAGVGVDPSEFVELEADLRALFAAVDAEVKVAVDLDEAAFAEAVAEIQAAVQDIDAMIEVDIDKASLEFVKARIEEALDDIQGLIELGVQPGQVAAMREYLEQRLKNIKADIEADVDEKSVASALARLKGVFSSGGEEAGGKFGDGVGKGLSTRTKLLAETVAILLEPLFVAVQDLAAAFTAVLGSAFNGLVAGGGALTPVIAGLGAVLTAGVVGSLGFGSALGAVNEEMKAATAEGRAFNQYAEGINEALAGLSPNAQSAARAFGEVRTELASVQESIQDRLFEDMDDTIRSLATQALPSMEEALQGAATEANIFGRDLADIANNTDFAGLFNDLQPAIRPALAAVNELVRTVEPFLRAAAPAAERVAEAFQRSATGLRQMTQNNPEGIADFLDRGLDSLSAWADLLANVGDLLGTIFAAGQSQGDSFVQTLSSIVERWDAWLEGVEGQQALAEFFEGGADTISALAPVVEALGEAFSTIVTDESRARFADLAQSLAEAIPTIADLIVQIGRLGVAEGLLNLVQAFQPVLDIVNALPDGVLEFAGTMLVVTRALKLASAAMKAFTGGSLPLLALTVAIGAAVTALDHFRAAQQEIDEVTANVSRSLQGNVDAIIAVGDASLAASAGVDAMSQSLVENGEDGEKLQKALGDIGLSAEDATDTLVALGNDPVTALKRLGEAQGLTAEEALNLANAINENDENIFAFAAGMDAISESTALTTEQQAALVEALEELQDQSEKTDLQAIAQESIRTAAGADDATQALLKEAEALTGISRTADDVLPLYEEFARLQVEAGIAANDLEAALASVRGEMGDSTEIQQVLIEQSLAATEARIAEGEAARAAAREQAQMARDIDTAVAAAAEQAGMSGEVALALQGLGDGARGAAKEADALRSALDLLLAPQLNAQEAADALQQNLADLAVQAMESAGALNEAGVSGDKWAASIDNTTQIGRENREAIREQIAGMLEYASASLEAGVANDEVAATVRDSTAALRDQLINGFGASEAQADAYIATLLGTPGLVETAITQPGMLDALVNGDELVLTYDEMGNPVVTNIATPGLDQAISDAETFQADLTGIDGTDPTAEVSANIQDVSVDAKDLKGVLDDVDATNPSPELSANTDEIQRDADRLQTSLNKLDVTRPDPRITTPGMNQAIADSRTLQAALDRLNRTNPSPNITLPGISSRISEVNSLKAAIDRLQSKSVTITTFERTLPGSMTGELITGPTVRQVGERGYREAIIPLDLPLNRVDPSVRDLAAMIRGQGPAPAATGPVQSLAPQVTHNHNWNINEVGDGTATAHKVMNRLIGSL